MTAPELHQRVGSWLTAEGAESDVVVSTRVRLARNLAGHRFVSRADLDGTDVGRIGGFGGRADVRPPGRLDRRRRGRRLAAPTRGDERQDETQPCHPPHHSASCSSTSAVPAYPRSPGCKQSRGRDGELRGLRRRLRRRDQYHRLPGLRRHGLQPLHDVLPHRGRAVQRGVSALTRPYLWRRV